MRETEFGRAHGFAAITSFEEFRARVPISTYDELRPWLDRVIAGEPSVLTREPVIAFEETGGSRSGRQAHSLYGVEPARHFEPLFSHGLRIWRSARPARSRAGPMSRSARSHGNRAASAEYRSGCPTRAPTSEPTLLRPSWLCWPFHHRSPRLTDIDEWRFATLAHLLAAPDLTIISVWSPTFLIGLLDAIPASRRGVGEGDSRWGRRDVSADPAPRARWSMRALGTTSDRHRAAVAPSRHRERLGRRRIAVLCQRLQQMLPHAFLQPKGLLATEGAVTTPCSASWPVPALSSAFLEFIDQAGRSHLCDELQEGESYRVRHDQPGRPLSV